MNAGGAYTAFHVCAPLVIGLECTGAPGAAMRGAMIAYMPNGGTYAPPTHYAPRSLRRHFQYSLEGYIRRRLSYHDLKIARHDPPAHVDIEQLEIFRGKL